MEQLYPREMYLKRIRPFYYECGLIKVLTGVRRCGKSSIMKLIINELTEKGVNNNNIFYFNLDKRPYRSIKTADQLDELIAKAVDNVEGTKFIFVDEVQNVTGFEEVINSFREEEDCSIFITGSNSYLLSGDLVTKLTGRYIETNINTLSFYEYIEMKKFYNKKIDTDYEKELFNYILEGGFPLTIKFDNFDDKRIYVKNIINEIYEKDVKPNKKIRNKHLFEQIKTYIINNFGATTSVNSLCDYLKKINGSKPTKNTIYNYLEILEKVKIISKCKRFDLKSKKSLNGDEKYYLTDLSFYFSLQTDNRINYGPVLENIVFNYSQMCGYTASIGKIGNLEIDFILRNELTNDYAYVQVAKTIDNGIYNDEGKLVTEEREYAPLEKIKDGYPKYLLTLDKILQKRRGVKHCNIIDFIINNEKF